MVVWLKIESWVIGKGGTKREGRKWGGCVGEKVWELLSFVALVCFECISTAVVEGACVRDYKGLRVCTVGTVG
jgi:hypothetical protein